MTDTSTAEDQIPDRFLVESRARQDLRFGSIQRFTLLVDDTPPVDQAGIIPEGEDGSEPNGRPLLIWRTTPSDTEPSPAFGDPSHLGGLPVPAIVAPGVTDLGKALQWAMDEGVSLRGLRLSQPRKGHRWSWLQLPDGADLSRSSLDRQTIGSPRGVTRGVSFKSCRLNDTMLRGVFEDCDFSKTMMFNTSLRLATFRNCRFHDAIMEMSVEGAVAFIGGQGDLTQGIKAWIRNGHPADMPEISPAYPALTRAVLRWKADPEIKMQHRRWWWANLVRKLTGRPPMQRWPYPEEVS